LTEGALLRTPGLLVDVGFGVSAVTTSELAAAFPAHEVLGLERDVSRVKAALREFPTLTLQPGGLEGTSREALVVRIANVARGLSQEGAAALHELVLPWLVDGGACLEGSTDIEGHVSAFWVLRRSGDSLQRESLVLHTDGERGFSPWLFRDVLPRALRREVRAGTEVHALLTEWDRCWQTTRSADALDSFMASARALSLTRRDVDVRFIEQGYTRWTR
jgi:hypothetical protein